MFSVSNTSRIFEFGSLGVRVVDLALTQAAKPWSYTNIKIQRKVPSVALFVFEYVYIGDKISNLRCETVLLFEKRCLGWS